MKKHLCAVLLMAAGILTARAQQTPHLFFDHLDIKKGLPEGNVKTIIEDREGYMWFSTQNGLVRYDGYRTRVYQLGDAKTHFMETTNVQGLLLDAHDNVWVSTLANGVFRYNRNTDTFQEFPYPQKNIFSQFTAGIDDKDGNIWGTYYTSNKAAIGKINAHTGKYELFTVGAGNVTYFSRPIRSANGDIWYGSNNGLHRYSFAQKKIISYLFFADTAKTRGSNPVYEAPSQPGIIWTNTFHGDNIDLRITRIDATTGNITEYKPGHAPGDINDAGINSFYEDKHKQLWMSTRLGISLLDRATGKITNYIPKDVPTPNTPEKWSFKDLAETPEGNFWMASTNSLSFFDTHTHDFRFYQANDNDPASISNTDIASKIIDRSGSLWLGLFHGGVNHLNKQKSAFQLIKPITGKVDSYPGGQANIQADENNTAIITTISGVYRWKAGTNHFEKIYGVPGEGIFTSYKTANGDELYIATQNGLVVKNLETGLLQRYAANPADSTGLPTNQIGIIREDHTGIIWFSTLNNKGVCSFDPKTKKFTHYPFRANLEPVTTQNKNWLDDSRVLAIFEDRQNNLMVGTNYGGVNQFHRDSKNFTSSFDRDGSAPKNMYCVNCMYQDTQDHIWVGTYLSGLFIFDPKKNTYTKQFNEQSGLLYNTVSSITQDLEGNIWTIGERGLARINPVTLSLKNFPADLFMPGTDISGAFNAIDRLTDGRIVIGLKNGLAYFDPKELNDNPIPPTVHIEEIAYSNPRDSKSEVTKVLAYGKKEIELPYNQNRIELSYIGLHFDSPDANTYAYQMEGYDKQWIQAGTDRWVTYTNLPPGHYTFKVMAANSSGVWNKTGDSIKITIRWPWWFTWWSGLIYVTVFVLLVYGFIRYRSRKLILEKQELEEKVAERTHQLSEQQEEITAQRDQLADTVDQLKSTQNQLIQSEKMASLGELTAGIAHEIQNPLNFVNNFAEVSAELLDEMEGEMDRGDLDEARAIANDVKQNLEKIRHHGKRADGIVKGMLQHSRTGNTTKEKTDLNKLADEYLRLAYHGLRAKDKSFNAELVTHFDEELPSINILPQDVGRVLLNLFTNAFYAVQQKEKKSKGKYKPTVEVATRLDTPPTGEKWAEIIVKDNGTGIPEAIKDKIMQPFFTTKPTGEGTGLGLSLSYDIIVKGHGGKISIDTQEGEYTEFTILLPVGKKSSLKDF